MITSAAPSDAAEEPDAEEPCRAWSWCLRRAAVIVPRALYPEVFYITVLATTDFSSITEIRPGNYAFLDLLPIKVGVVEQRQVSLSVLATVISKNADFFITDAGSKTLTSDIGVHGMASTQGYGIAYPSEHYLEPDCEMVVAGLSEEHGKLIRGDFDLPIGAQVRIIPNHSCPVANLAREYVVLDDNRQQTWPIDAAANAH